ncbi:MAG: VOC family protein [Candidatus Rokubacteria bacterium]|nr:VOC family protein [Candidatus Rokubacteria bacterium]
MKTTTYDRAAQDVGNIVALEHVNVWVTDQRLATAFYIAGLGFTRDPYLMVNIDNMWVNCGKQQFHLITKPAQVLRGTTGLVVPSIERLIRRLERVKEQKLLDGTKFGYAVEDKTVLATCPWGNRLRLHAAGPEFPDMPLGMPYVEFTVPPGQAAGIAKFYERVFEAASTVVPNGSAPTARVRVGPSQELRFRETTESIPEYDGHHIAIYVANFSRAHGWLRERGLVTEESNPYQYRFNWLTDPDSGERLFEIEHEVRSLTHPMYMRPLVNRNPSQTQREFVPWADAFFAGAE